MPKAVPEFQLLMTQLAHHLGERVVTLTHRISHLDVHEALKFVTDAYPDLAAPFLHTAADLAVQWYNEQPTVKGATPFTAKPDPLREPDRLQANARWSILQSDPAEAFRGSAQRAVFDSARQTIITNVGHEPGAKYARYASATACGFCRLLATRGAIYATEESATRVVGRTPALSRGQVAAGVTVGDAVYRGELHYGGQPRGSRPLGEKYHDHCHCLAVMVRPGDTYEPPSYVGDWADDYQAALKQAKQARKDGTATGAITFKELCNRMDQMRRAQVARLKAAVKKKPKPPQQPAPTQPTGPLATVRRKASTTFDPKTDLAAVNPNFKAGKQWKTNCTRCATAVELRHRGFEVGAEPIKPNAGDNTHRGELERWLSPDGSVAGTSVPSGHRPALPGEVLGMSKGNRVFHTLPTDLGEANRDRIDNAVQQWGHGSRGFVTVVWKGRRSAHIFNVENRNGHAVYTDGQTGQDDVADYFRRVSPAADSVFVARTDDLTPTAKVMDWVRELTDAEVAAANAKAGATP